MSVLLCEWAEGIMVWQEDTAVIMRVAKSSDLEALINLDPVSRTDGKRVPFIKQAVRSGICHLIESDGRIVAYGVLSHAFFQYGFVEMLYVHPDFRRRHYGSQMIAYLESLCMSEKLFTSTNRSNIPAQKLFVRLGYEPSGVVEHLDEGDPELIYMKRLIR